MDGSESSSLTVTTTGGTLNSLHARGYVFTKAGGATWSVADGGAGTDNSAGTTCSFTYASDPGVEANDWLVTVWFVNTDLYTHGTHTLTASGLSSITTASRGNSAITQGADMRCGLVTHVIGAGPSSGVATYSNVASGSGASAPTGSSVIIRLREVAGSGTVLPLFMHNYRQRRSA